MNFKFIKKGIIAAVFASALLIPASQVQASDFGTRLAVPQQNRAVGSNDTLVSVVAEVKPEMVMETTIKIESTEEMQLREMIFGYAFPIVGEDDYLEVYREALEGSELVGKVFADSILEVVTRGEDWTEVKSGNVSGFVKTENILSGRKAFDRAKEILVEKYQGRDISTLNKEEIDSAFVAGETLAEEIARLAAEETARIEAERLALIQRGQSVVDYACQFIGNPYVYGGQSLTHGTDCSGFVRGVYRNFGIYLPRTSYSMRYVGTPVSYSEILPGDIVCYSGHVGIYAGNGQIVNAIDDAHGIGISSARYSRIITIRRMF